MAHHEASDCELVVLHQRLKSLVPVLAQSLLERFKGFGNEFVWIVDQPETFSSLTRIRIEMW